MFWAVFGFDGRISFGKWIPLSSGLDTFVRGHWLLSTSRDPVIVAGAQHFLNCVRDCRALCMVWSHETIRCKAAAFWVQKTY